MHFQANVTGSILAGGTVFIRYYITNEQVHFRPWKYKWLASDKMKEINLILISLDQKKNNSSSGVFKTSMLHCVAPNSWILHYSDQRVLDNHGICATTLKLITAPFCTLSKVSGVPLAMFFFYPLLGGRGAPSFDFSHEIWSSFFTYKTSGLANDYGTHQWLQTF
jgi:hypothetical protein